MSPSGSGLTADVVVCTYTEDRWGLLVEAIESVLGQSVEPQRLIICVDHNPDLLRRVERAWAAHRTDGPQVIVLANAFEGRLGSARNTALLATRADIVAFLDDDAVAEADWLERLLATYTRNPAAVAVGGMPRPRYGASRPSWFPPEFDWVFGCHYRGLPTRTAPVRHLIGANMSVRRQAAWDQGGFHADNHDDMDLSHRVAHAYGRDAVLYEPSAVVRHYVSAPRLTWSYFWRRCFSVNRGKVEAFDTLGDAGDIRAEISFALRYLARLPLSLLQLLVGDPAAIRQWFAGLAGLALAAAGYTVGRLRAAVRPHDRSTLTRGIEGMPSATLYGQEPRRGTA